MGIVLCKRVYELPSEDDGLRVLVDRLWPRGLSKERAQVDVWLKEIGPSTELRQWFDHKPERFEEFSSQYYIELRHNQAVQSLMDLVLDRAVVTLLYAAHDVTHNHAKVLVEYLQHGKSYSDGSA